MVDLSDKENSENNDDFMRKYGIDEQKFYELRQYLTEEQIEDFKGVFEMFDADGDKSISVKELSTIMRSLGQNPTEEEVKQMIAEADKDKSGNIEFPEFCDLMAKRINQTEQDEELMEVFKLFDKNGDGFIDAHDLKKVFVELGHDKITEEDCRLLVKLHDSDKDGTLSFDEFVYTLMSK